MIGILRVDVKRPKKSGQEATCPPIEGLRQGKQNENHQVPEGVTDGDEKNGVRAEIEIAPEQAADGRGQDEHEIAVGGMDERVERRGQKKSPDTAEPELPSPLKKTAPKKLLAGTDEEREEKNDAQHGRSLLKGIDPGNAGAGKGKETKGDPVPGKKDAVEDDRRKGPEQNFAAGVPA